FADFAAQSEGSELAARAQLFGVPAAVVGGPAPPAVTRQRIGDQDDRVAPRVADLTSLWAGPTCARLLARAGAYVVKIESSARPDGARRGHAGFYDWLHREAEEAAFDFTTEDGRAALRAELDQADVVLESSRPRALRQLGVRAEDWLAARPGRVWLSLGGYARDEPDPGRVAFGDDAAAAGGLVAYEPDGDGTPLFVGDAIADPLSGIKAARAVAEALRRGGGELIHVSLAGVAADVVARYPMPSHATVPGATPPQLPKPDI
ncbi:MAG: CoA transferase, partial [Acidimicrobiales bacterium]|nr:CoA transferase [Acidimicrobiales bacterium]